MNFIEPALIPTVEEMVQGTATDGARCDVSARGVWNDYEKTFFDSYLHMLLERLYKKCENAKKRKYNDRIVNIEGASFTPLVFSTTGGMSKEYEKLNKRLAEHISL